MQAHEVLQGNIKVHRIEAPHYEQWHPEIFNAYEQFLIHHDLALICSLFSRHRLQVLDIGCGTGNLALKFLQGGHQVDGVDISREMLEVLRYKQPKSDQLRLFELDADSFLDSATVHNEVLLSDVL